MHDPMTVAFDIKSPFRGKPSQFWPKGYRSTLVTIWHVDPERDGSDDSCGYSYVRLSAAQRERLKNAAWREGRDPYFQCVKDKEWHGTRQEAEAMYRGLVLFVADVLRVPMSYGQAARMAARAIHSPDCVDAAGAFCFLAGYHANSEEDRASDRELRFIGTMSGIAREILTDRRAWYRHPRWHIWHWKIQIHALQSFKRWAFSRCNGCGARFAWGYSPMSTSWNGTGPRWFRREQYVYHSDCCPSGKQSVAQEAPSAAK
jgi:hypothetical protein